MTEPLDEEYDEEYDEEVEENRFIETEPWDSMTIEPPEKV